jgi:hypothetical protein
MEDPALALPTDDSDPSSQIQTNVEGNGNQVIDKVLGGNMIAKVNGNVNIYERIPLPPPVNVVQTLTQQECRQRQILLDKVQDFWVESVLKTSLHTKALIEMGLQKRLDLVQRPFREVDEFPETNELALAETHPTKIFDQIGEGRTLLILGEPGSGKTVALLKLAEDLIVRAKPDLRQPIPVVFNLSSWSRETQIIEKWLVQELQRKYHVPPAIGRPWVKSEALVLLLDGLDEVRADQRNACVKALNLFMQTHGTTEIAICCRIGDYQELTDRLTLRSAICIKPLTVEQIDFYFEQAGDHLVALKIVLQNDRELQELAKSPLILSIMSLAYQDHSPGQLNLGGNTEDYRRQLFATYVDRMFQRRGTIQKFPRKDTQRWLIWLSQQMTISSQTIFLIERLQPSCLQNKNQNIRYRIESSLMGVLFFLLGEVLIFLLHGEVSSAKYGVFFMLAYGLWISIMGDIGPVETLKWSWRETKKSFLTGIFLGVFIKMLLSLSRLLSGISISALIDILLESLIGGLFGGLICGLLGGFRGSAIQQKIKPNQGIFRSAKNAAIAGTVILFGVVLISKKINGLGFVLGQIGVLIYGGNACIRHFALRSLLYRKGYIPWNYARFLDYATEILFLQKVGGGYIFVHRMLLEYFAEMPLEQEES